MKWFENIYTLAILTLDYGDEFSLGDKFEYQVLTFDKKRNKDNIPGTYMCKKSVTKRIKDLKKEIEQKTNRECKIDKKSYIIYIKEESNSLKHRDLKSRKEKQRIQKLYEKSERKRETMNNNYSPGGNRDHSER